MLVIENCNSLSELRQKLIDGEEVRTARQEPCEDAVSRQWLMECVNEGWIKFDTEKDENRFIHLVRDIAPPVNPQPCGDLISRKAILEEFENDQYHLEFCKEHHIERSISMEMVRIRLHDLPSVNPQPKTGHWIKIKPYPLQMHDYECSERTHETDDNTENYCSECGAKMVKPQESVADNAWLSTFEAIKKAYNAGVSEQEDVLDKIRAEIEALNPVDYVSMSSYEGHRGASDMKDDVLQIIDKYKSESEDKE